MESDQKKWNDRYGAEASPRRSNPHDFLKKNIRRLGQGRALDVASGEGWDAVFLAQNGWKVEAVDISRVALKKSRQWARDQGVAIRTIWADLDSYSIEKEGYDLIVNFYFLDRRLIPKMKRGLKEGGKIIFETYVEDPEARNSETLSNPKYVLKTNELLTRFRDFRILLYREGIVEERGKKRAIASLLAEKTS